MNDNTTPMPATEYDEKISRTIPYYAEFYTQTFDVVTQCSYPELDWLDLGCGTGTLEEKAFREFPSVHFTVVDSSEKMLEMAKNKLTGYDVHYINKKSEEIIFLGCFNVVTAIQSHHYLTEEGRREAVKRVYDALRDGGIFICFENVVPESETVKKQELLRWGRFQQRQGKTEAEALAHNKRCGTSYFPITVQEHIDLLKSAGFTDVHVFWFSYMQMGVYAFKRL